MAAVGLLVHCYLLIIFQRRNLLNKEAYKPYLWVMVKGIFTTTSEYIFQTYFRFQNRGLDKKTSSIQFDIV
jgi:hypothetical protein